MNSAFSMAFSDMPRPLRAASASFTDGSAELLDAPHFGQPHLVAAPSKARFRDMAAPTAEKGLLICSLMAKPAVISCSLDLWCDFLVSSS